MNLLNYHQYTATQQLEIENNQKMQEFKARILPFKDIKSLQEAKKLASKVLPTVNEITIFYIGNAKCTIINKADNYRICFDTSSEFICYDFI